VIEHQPEYGRIPEAGRRYGLSRSRLYLLAGEGLVRFVKVGNATLVDFRSVRDFLATCQPAEIRSMRAAAPQARADTEIPAELQPRKAPPPRRLELRVRHAEESNA
jgi:hypothetical protein